MTTLSPSNPFIAGLVRHRVKNGGDPAALRMQYAELPAALRSVRRELLNPPAGSEDAYEAADAWSRDDYPKKGLLFLGGPGTGKTTLAVAAMRAWVEHNEGVEPVRFWDAPAGLEKVKRGFNWTPDSNQDEPEPVEALAADNAVLLIDDLGQGKVSDWVAYQFFLILNAATQNGTRLLITTNKTPTELEDNLVPAAVSRIYGLCQPLIFRNGDFRRM